MLDALRKLVQAQNRIKKLDRKADIQEILLYLEQDENLWRLGWIRQGEELPDGTVLAGLLVRGQSAVFFPVMMEVIAGSPWIREDDNLKIALAALGAFTADVSMLCKTGRIVIEDCTKL